MPAVILVEPFDPVNVAAIARVMASFGAGPLIIVRPLFGFEHLDPAIARGGTSLLDRIETATGLEPMRERYDVLIGTSGKPSSGSPTRTYLTPFELRARGTDERCALVFGPESDGLRVSDLNLCDLIVSIETRPEQRALNLSHAVAVILAIIQRIEDPVQMRHPPSVRANRDALLESIERLYRITAQANGTYRDDRLETQRRVWNRILARSDASHQEISALFGLITQFEQALKAHGSRSTHERSAP